MVIGRIPISSSFNAISIGLLSPVPPAERFSSSAKRIGAPIEICRDLAPTILAFSNLVIFGGPTSTFSWTDV